MLMSLSSVSRSVPRLLSGALCLALVSATAVSAQDSAASDTPAKSRANPPVVSLSKELQASVTDPVAAPVITPLDTLDLRVPRLNLRDDASGESSSAGLAGTSEPELLALGATPAAAAEAGVPGEFARGGGEGGMQPPPYRRRRYGRPNYNDRWHNTDGSNKLAFVAGGGFTVPAASTGKRLDLNYALKGGAGINLSRKLGVLLEFNFDRFGVQGRELDNQFTLYNSLGLVNSDGSPVDFSGLDAKSYIWSFTLNPTITLAESDSNSLYAVVGGGLYHRVVNFTLPQVGVSCDSFGFCFSFQQDQTFDHYANNTAGVNGGIGISHKISRFSNQRVFAEARYVYVFDAKDANSQNSFYPPANFSTSYFPVTVGLRF